MKAARRMTGRLPKRVGKTWCYLKKPEVLTAAGLHTITHRGQRHSIVKWVADRPIYGFYQAVEKRRGITPRIFWWEQPMDLDQASVGAPTTVAAEGDRGEGPHPLATGPGAHTT